MTDFAELRERMVELAPEMRSIRHDIHRHPELAYEEKRTAGLVDELRVVGDHEVTGGRVEAEVTALAVGENDDPRFEPLHQRMFGVHLEDRLRGLLLALELVVLLHESEDGGALLRARLEPHGLEGPLEVLDLLHYRQSLVQKRTSIANQIHAFARSKGLAKFRLPGIRSRKQVTQAPGTTETESLLLGSRLLLFDELTRQIEVTEAKLDEKANNQRAIELLRTHPGIGPITSLALIHTLGDVRRFRRKEEVVSFVGLDPLEKSSGETSGLPFARATPRPAGDLRLAGVRR